MKKSFLPKILPIELNDKDLLKLYKKSAEAKVKLTKFNMLLENSPVQETAIMFFSLNESVESTKIEGTQATFDEVLESEITGNKNTDVQEILNYLEALQVGFKSLDRTSINTRLFLELHKIILKNSRGENRSPGEYRKIQNFIGPSNRIEDASYIPPEPQKVEEYISNLEKYINDEIEDDIDPLIKAGIIHAQFETIHPFLDGNGRLGRILITLYLLDKKLIYKPTFFLSEHLKKNKYKYYALLNKLRNDNPNWPGWLEFFLEVAVAQSDFYIEKLQKVEELFAEMTKFAEGNEIDKNIVMFLFKKPFFRIIDISSTLSCSYNKARTSTLKLSEAGKVFADDKRRNKIFRFYDLIDIFKK